MTYPSGTALVYGRDTQGRIETIDQVATPSNLPIVTGTSYLPFGPLTQLSFAGGASQSVEVEYFPDSPPLVRL